MEKELNMRDNIKISVIVTTFNVEKYIRECVESILKQSIKEIELICIDDASTDQSLEILKEYEKKDTRVKIIELNESIGPSSARNIGYKVAEGEYVYQIDGDDYVIEDALERMYTCAKKNDLDLLTFSANAFADSKEIEEDVQHLLNLYKRTSNYIGVKTGIKFLTDFIRNGDFFGNLYCIFLKKSFFELNNLYLLEGLFASADSPFQMYLEAQRVMCIPDTLYMRRFRENSIVTSKKNLIKFESILVQFAYEVGLWQQYVFEEAVEKELERYFMMGWEKVLKTYNDVVDKNNTLRLIPKHKFASFIYYNWIEKKNLYWTKQTRLIIDEIKQYKDIIIYGAKYIAKEVKEILDKYEIYNYFIAVSNNKSEERFEGQKVYNIEELDYMKESAIVIIATNKRHFDAIREKLNMLGFRNLILIE